MSTSQAPTKETITAKMSRWAAALDYKHLSQDAIYQAKRFLLDSVGCALGGYQQHDVKIALKSSTKSLDAVPPRSLEPGSGLIPSPHPSPTH